MSRAWFIRSAWRNDRSVQRASAQATADARRLSTMAMQWACVRSGKEGKVLPPRLVCAARAGRGRTAPPTPHTSSKSLVAGLYAPTQNERKVNVQISACL